MAVSVSNCLTFQNTAKKYETSTGTYHRYIPNVPQEFDCRIKANIRPESKYIDLTIKDEEFKTLYFQEYPRKIILPERCYRPPQYDSLNYIRSVEEKLIAEPVRPLAVPLSEMKKSYHLNYVLPKEDDVKPPAKVAKCYVTKEGCEQQPAIPPQRKGFWRWTDPYLTTYKSHYAPSSDEVDDNIKGEILTYYNEDKFDLPSVSGNKTLFDKTVFKNVLPNRLRSRAQKHVPNFGMQTNYQDHYVSQTFSKCYSSRHDSCTEYNDSLPPASCWQTLAPPGMYCTEYCNIGRKSVRCTIDQSPPKKQIVRTKNCCRLY